MLTLRKSSKEIINLCAPHDKPADGGLAAYDRLPMVNLHHKEYIHEQRKYYKKSDQATA
jgi:hypothetical protein